MTIQRRRFWKNREKKEGLYNRTRGSIVGTGESIDVIPQASNYLVMYVESKCFLSLYLNVMNLGDSFKQLSKLYPKSGSSINKCILGTDGSQ